jgi:hypothetical protein
VENLHPVHGQFMRSAANGQNGQKKKGLAPPLSYPVIQRIISALRLKVQSLWY